MQEPLNNLQENGVKIKDYFRQLERRFRLGLLLAFLILIGALSLYFHFQFHYTLKETGQLNLIAIAESQRNTVDLFLQERVINILSLFRSSTFSLTPTKQQMGFFLENLRQVSDAFIDVGLLNAQGHQIGYAGPFPQLRDKDYSSQQWLITLLSENRAHYISDIYTGFRNKLHFTIAVKQIVDGQTVVLRSTLDPDKFYLFLRTIHRGKGSESFIINNAGIYQVVDPARGQLFSESNYIPPVDQDTGASEISQDGVSILVAHAWLKETDWALMVSEPLALAYAELYRARRIMFISSAFIILFVIAAIWNATNRLIGKARENAEKKEELYTQLLHASKLASLGELATGVAHEINNPLAIIIATTGVIRDRFNPEFNLENNPDVILQDLETIDSAVIRTRGITQQLLNYGRKSNPKLIPSDVNHILEEVLSGVKERELALADISIERNLADNLPDVMIDPDQIRQVFFNLINNAGDAICAPGKITVATTAKNGQLRVTITDTGHGLDSDQLKKIFDPFYSTKEVGKGTGLGLSVSLGIMESMGGTIEVQSLPGVGSAFSVVLPIKSKQGGENEL